MTATGNLSVEGQARYKYVARLLVRDVPPPARVVELGSAPGDQIARLADLGYEAVSVDIGTSADGWSDGEVGRMERLLKEHGVEAVTWDLEQTPYPLPDASFDAVIMTEVYEHLRDFPVRSLQEVRRVLKPGGRLYLTTPNAAYLVNRVRALQGQVPTASSIEDWIGGIPHARHAREYTFAEMRHVLEYAGLRIVSMSSEHFYLDSGRQGVGALVKRGLAAVARHRPTLGPSIIAVAERPVGS